MCWYMRANGKMISIKEEEFSTTLSLKKMQISILKYLRTLTSWRTTNGRNLKESLMRVNGMVLGYWRLRVDLSTMDSSMITLFMGSEEFIKKTTPFSTWESGIKEQDLASIDYLIMSLCSILKFKSVFIFVKFWI